MLDELWKDIAGYEGLYQVSNLGRVKCLPREWFVNNGRKFHNGLIKKTTINTWGYEQTSLSKDGVNKLVRINRLVAQAFLGNPENKKEVNHKNLIKTDNRVENLEWATPSENVRHAFENMAHISLKGESHPMAKITEDKVHKIRYCYSTKKFTNKQLAMVFNIKLSMVDDVLYRNWKHI